MEHEGANNVGHAGSMVLIGQVVTQSLEAGAMVKHRSLGKFLDFPFKCSYMHLVLTH